MAFFFATADDLLPVLLGLEGKHPIKYTPVGQFESPDVPSFASARELPTLFLPAPQASASACPKYLVTCLGAPVKSRRISRSDGSTAWSIDQLENGESIVFAHGGRFGEDVLLQGEVRTVHGDPVAQKLQRAFDAAIRKAFTKIQAFRVGKEAEALLDAGIRLTAARQSPAKFDLARPSA
jgi:hypothetical protein